MAESRPVALSNAEPNTATTIANHPSVLQIAIFLRRPFACRSGELGFIPLPTVSQDFSSKVLRAAPFPVTHKPLP